MILFLIFFSASISYEKTICICSNCQKNDECSGLRPLDPQSDTFYEDYFAARSNSKDIKIFFSSKVEESVTIDMSVLNGQNIYFKNIGNYQVNLDLPYKNGQDYESCDFVFDYDAKIQANFICTNPATGETALKMGRIVMVGENEIKFQKTTGALVLYYKSAEIGLWTLVNVTKVVHTSKDINKIMVDQYKDGYTVNFAKSKNTLSFNEDGTVVTIEMQYFKGSQLMFGDVETGNSRSSLIINIEQGMKYDELPMFKVNKLKTLTINGDLWEAKNESMLIQIIDVNQISIKSSEVPFNILSNSIELNLVKSTKFYGNITGNSRNYAAISFNLNSKERVQIQCLDMVSGDVKINSPLIELIINKFSLAALTSPERKFPIIGAMSSSEFSTVTITEILNPTLDGKPYLTEFSFLNEVRVLPTDTEMQKLMNGVDFMSLPESSIEEVDFIFTFTELTYIGFPGFSERSSAMKIKMTKKDNKFIFNAYLTESPYETYPFYLCIYQDDDCSNIFTSGSNLFKDIYNDDQAGKELDKYIPDKYKKVIIGTDISGLELDLSKLGGNNKDIEIYSSAYFGKTSVSLQGKSTADKILLKKIKLSTYDFSSITNITLLESAFATNAEITLPLHSYLDQNSLKALLAINSNIDFNYLYVLEANALNFGNIEWKVNDIVVPYKNVKNNFTLLISNSNNVIGLDDSFKDETTVSKKTIIKLIEDSSITINNEGWNEKYFPNLIDIDHGDLSLTAVFTKQNQNKCFNIIGSGSVSVEIQYGESTNICVSVENAANSCKDGSFNRVVASTDTESLKNIVSTNLAITVDSSDNGVDFPFSIFDNRLVSLQPSDEDTKTKINIKFDVNEIESFYSKIQVNKNILISAAQASSPIKFGEIEFIGNEIDPTWKLIDIQVTRFKCDFNYLPKFKTILILDQLVLAGDVPTESQTVKFQEDEDANDLVIDLTKNVEIIVKEKQLQIGSQTFQITQSNNYDILLVAKQNIEVSVDCQSTGLIPRISIDFKDTESTLNLKGTWSAIDLMKNSVIDVRSEKMVSISLSGSVPLSISKPNVKEAEIVYNFILSKSSSIQSIETPIEEYLTTQFYVKSAENINEIMQFKVEDGITFSSFDNYQTYFDLIKVHSANIQMIVQRIVGPQKMDFCELIFDLAISKTSTSSIEIIEELKNGMGIRNEVNIKSDVFDKIDEYNFEFFKRTNTLIKVKTANLKLKDLKFSYLPSNKVRAHGFDTNHNCLEVKVIEAESTYSQLIITHKILPSKLPFIVEVTDSIGSSKAELAVSLSGTELTKLGELLPNKINDIIITVVKQPEFTFDPKQLASGKSVRININAKGVKKIDITVKLPQDESIDLALTNFNLVFESANAATDLVAKRLAFTNINFVSKDFLINEKVGNLAVDADSLNLLLENKIITKFDNLLEIDSANIIIFTPTGWEFAENTAKQGQEVKESEFSNIKVVSKPAFELRVLNERVTAIKGLVINTDKQQDGAILVEFGRHWQNIRSIDPQLKIVSTASKARVLSASFPTVDPLESFFEMNPENVDLKFETDSEGKFDQIIFGEDQVVDKIVKFDLRKLPDEYKTVRGNKVSFEKESGVVFVNDVGTFSSKNIYIKEKANAKFSNISLNKLIMNKGSKLEGRLVLNDPGVIELHWDLTTDTTITLSDPLTTVAALEVTYDSSSADESQYNSKLLNGDGIVLIQGQFQCDTFIKLSSFKSSFNLFNEGNDNVLKLMCDSSSLGKVLILKGSRSFPKEDDNSDSKNKNPLDGGQTAGVVIACVVVAGLVVGITIYVYQRKKIDRLKNEIPYENRQPKNSDFEETSSIHIESRANDDDSSEV